MSIEYNTFLGLGWELTTEDFDYCTEQGKDWRDYYEDDFLHIVNGYTDDMPYFLGVEIDSVYDGELLELNKETFKKIDTNTKKELMDIAKNVFGVDSPPQFFLVSQIL